VRCDVAERNWSPPARPADCPYLVDYGQYVKLTPGNAPVFVCATTALGGSEALDLGERVAACALRCDSAHHLPRRQYRPPFSNCHDAYRLF
jgi:hypothetical protein